MAVNCPPLTIYSFDNVVLTIDDRLVTGFWEGDDAIAVERPDDIGTPLTGADGASVVSITASETAKLTIKLMPNSVMNPYLKQVVNTMRAGSQRILRISLRDTTTGEGGGCTAAIVVKEPGKKYGEKSDSRDWEIFCNCWQENDMIYAPVPQ